MIQFTKPENLNGAELLAQLNAGGIAITQPPVIDGNNDFWLDIATTDKVKATPIVEAHNGTIIAPEPTIEDKLASVGLSVADLKTALGL
jgi:hypothetical protein